MKAPAYTRDLMDVQAESGESAGRGDGAGAMARSVLARAGGQLGEIRERSREAYRDDLARWQAMRDELATLERRPGRNRRAEDAARTAEQDAAEREVREIRARVESLTAEINREEGQLSRLELAQQALESAVLVVEGSGDADRGAGGTKEVALRIMEAQEAERARLAQEVHDGPAQALTNAIFQVEYVERTLEQDPVLARTELRFLRELLRRELGDVRTFISQLRPRSLEQHGLVGSITEAAASLGALTGADITSELQAPDHLLGDAQQTVVLRLVQEALQNVRKHAAARHVSITSRAEGSTWVLEVRDDGRGFDPTSVSASRGRNFGLQFMRERAELIGARFDVRSRPDGGTVVSLVIPLQEEKG